MHADVKQVACGLESTLVLKTNGDVYGAGRNSHGILGDESKAEKNTLVQAKGLTGQ